MAWSAICARKRPAARQQLVRAAADLSADIDRELSGLITVLETLASSVSLARGDLAQFHERASSALGPRQAFVLLLDANGQQLLNTRVPYGTPLPRTSDPAIAEAVMNSRSLYVSNGFVGTVAGQQVVNIAVPIVRAGAVPNILVLAINASRLDALVAAFDAPEAWSVRLLDRKGQLACVCFARRRPPCAATWWTGRCRRGSRRMERCGSRPRPYRA